MNLSANESQESTRPLSNSVGFPDRFVVRRLIGKGGMGEVYQAYDKVLSREVAIKILLCEAVRENTAQERFLREARVLANLKHPNIVQMFSSGLSEQGNPYHVMEFIAGEPLSTTLATAPLGAETFYELFSQILKGLAHAHQQGVVHRDLKPGNIMQFTGNDGKAKYKIIDFGIAKFAVASARESGAGVSEASRTLTGTEAILGSPLYISPEQCRGLPGNALSDIYSLACIMYECITGNPPFRGETTMATLYLHMTELPKRLDEDLKSPQSKRLAELIHRCLEKQPEARPQSIAEIEEELKQIFNSDIDSIDLFSRKTPARRISNKTRVLVTSACVGALAISGCAAWLIQHNAGSIRISNTQDKNSRNIEKAKNKIEKWEKTQPPVLSISAEKKYLDDLFALGHEQLLSSITTNYAAAEQTFNKAILSCEKAGSKFDGTRASALALKAKAEWKQGKFSNANEDFKQALQLAKRLPLDKDLQIDILSERMSEEIYLHKFDEARLDYVAAFDLYKKLKGEINPLEPCLAFDLILQKLDRRGVNRSDMACNAALALRSLKPENSEQAAKMLELSNAFVERLSQCKLRTKDEIRTMILYSESLLPMIEGHEELKSATKALPQIYKDYM